MYQSQQLNSHQSNLDSHLHQRNIYSQNRHLLKDYGTRENLKDHPDVQDVEMVNFDMFGTGVHSEREIKAQSNLNDIHRRDLQQQSILLDNFKKQSQVLVNSHIKQKQGYEGYIDELERENQNLKIVESQLISLKDQIRQLEQEQTKYMTELNILGNRVGTDPEIINLLKARVHKLQQEKLQLLDLVNINKVKIEELHKRIHNQQVDYFPDKPQLLREIELLEQELSRKSVVTEERVVYREIPVREQPEIIEEIIQKKCNDSYSSNCKRNNRYSYQASTTNTQSQYQNEYKSSYQQNLTPSFTKRDRNVQSYRVENSKQAYDMNANQSEFKRGRSYSQTHKYWTGMKKLPLQMISRSRSKKKYLFQIPKERRKRFEELRLLWDRKLNFRKYEEIYQERDQLNLFLQFMEQVQIKIQEYEQLIEEQKNKITQLQKEKGIYEAECDSLKEVVDSLEHNMEEIQEQNVKAQEDLLQQLKRKDEEKEEEKTELRDKFQKKIKYLEYQVYEFEQSKNENEKLKKKINELQTEHEDNIQQLKDSQINPDHFNDLQNNLKIVTNEKDNLFKEIENMNKNLQEKDINLETIKKQLNDEIDQQKQKYQKLEQQSEIKVQNLDEKIQDLQNEIDNIRQQSYQNTVEDKQSNHLEELENFDIHHQADDLLQTPEKPLDRNFDIEDFDNQPKVSIPQICEKCKDIEDTTQQNKELYQKMEQNYHQTRGQLEQANETILKQNVQKFKRKGQ